MPEVARPFDRFLTPQGPQAPPPVANDTGPEPLGNAPQQPPNPDVDPPTHFGAIWRGFCSKCPACDGGRLFAAFLKPVATCGACREDWTPQRADDFPPYIVILVLGHVIVPGMASVEIAFHPAMWVHFALWLPLALILGMGLLQPIKGAVIAYQWGHGMGGFSESRRRPKPVSSAR